MLDFETAVALIKTKQNNYIKELINNKFITEVDIKNLLNTKGYMNQNLYHIAAMNNNIEALEFINDDIRVYVNEQDSYNRTPLHYAAENNNLAAVIFFVNNGAQVNVIDKSYLTALHLAALKSSKEIISTLIMHGADINQKDIYQRNALHLAAIEGALDSVEFLAKNIADINMQDLNGKTALQYVIEYIFILLNKLNKENEEEVDRLATLAKHRIDILIANGADIYHMPNNSKSVFEQIESYQSNNPSIKKWLIDLASQMVQSNSEYKLA